jgi:hypothetical protein
MKACHWTGSRRCSFAPVRSNSPLRELVAERLGVTQDRPKFLDDVAGLGLDPGPHLTPDHPAKFGATRIQPRERVGDRDDACLGFHERRVGCEYPLPVRLRRRRRGVVPEKALHLGFVPVTIHLLPLAPEPAHIGGGCRQGGR